MRRRYPSVNVNACALFVDCCTIRTFVQLLLLGYILKFIFLLLNNDVLKLKKLDNSITYYYMYI